MDHDGASLLGNHYSQTDHEPAKLTNVKGPAGGIGMTTGMGKTPSGYGHKAHQRNGNLRLSGHPGSHQLGEKEVNNRAGRHPASQLKEVRKKQMFTTIKFYSGDGCRQIIREAESFTILRCPQGPEADGSAEITLPSESWV